MGLEGVPVHTCVRGLLYVNVLAMSSKASRVGIHLLTMGLEQLGALFPASVSFPLFTNIH
jgi:hypothetical protein